MELVSRRLAAQRDLDFMMASDGGSGGARVSGGI